MHLIIFTPLDTNLIFLQIDQTSTKFFVEGKKRETEDKTRGYVGTSFESSSND